MTAQATHSPRTAAGLGGLILRLYACAFVALLGGGVFLGIDWVGELVDGGRGHRPLVPGAAVLLAPAGVLLIVAFVARLAGTWPYTRGGRPYLAVSLGGIATGLALAGAGMLAVSQAEIWRALTLPLILLVGGYGLLTLVAPRRRRAFLDRARAHGGGGWALLATTGLVIVLIVVPVGVAWSLGLITIR